MDADTLDPNDPSSVAFGSVGSGNESKWYVSLGDGTFVLMDEKPFVFFAPASSIRVIDDMLGGNAPDCQSAEADRLFGGHIHIKDLVFESHWADHTDVTEETLPHE